MLGAGAAVDGALDAALTADVSVRAAGTPAEALLRAADPSTEALVRTDALGSGAAALEAPAPSVTRCTTTAATPALATTPAATRATKKGRCPSAGALALRSQLGFVGVAATLGGADDRAASAITNS